MVESSPLARSRGIACAAGFMAVWIATLVLGTVLLHPAITGSLSAAPASMRLALELLSLASVAVPTSLFALLRPARRRRASRISAPVAALIGSVAGLAWLSSALGANGLAGALSVGMAASVPHIPVWLAACLANAAFQELLIRGYPFDVLRGSLGIFPATYITTALFIAFHPGAFVDGPLAVLQMAVASFLLAELRLLAGGLVVPIAAHFAWNAAGGIGLGAVALADDYPHALSLSIGNGTSLSTGAMGIEGSPWTLLVTTAFCVGLAMVIRVRPKHMAVDAAAEFNRVNQSSGDENEQ